MFRHTYLASIRFHRFLGIHRAGNPVWGPPKTESSTRTIPVADVVVDAIKQHFKDFGPHESGMFTTDLGAFVDTSTIHGA
jgi:hypothetical protein